MPNRDPSCVFVAENLMHAQFVINWLDQHDISAEVAVAYAPGQFEILTSQGQGVVVRVRNPEQAEEAARLLTEMEWARVMKEAVEDLSEERIPVVCEECGGVSYFQALSRGSCQLCRHCNAYVDVGDEEMDNEPEEEGDDEGPPSEGVQLPPGVRPES
jgi:hypothetical protein